jgi:hypothetical protein
MLCSELIFKNSFIGVLFGILVAALTHPLYDIFYWKAPGHPLGKAGTYLFCNRHGNDHGIELGTGHVGSQGCPTLWTTNSRF